MSRGADLLYATPQQIVSEHASFRPRERQIDSFTNR